MGLFVQADESACLCVLAWCYCGRMQKTKRKVKEYMKRLFDATARKNEIEKRKRNMARKLRFLEEKMAEVPADRQKTYSSFVEKSVVRLLYGTTAQEIWHDWQWRSNGLPAYFKTVALAAAGN